MSVPDFQSIMLPVLNIMSDGGEHSIHEITSCLAIEFHLTEDEINELLPSGKQSLFYNRVGWARTYLAKAGLIEQTKRTFYRITARGQDVLRKAPLKINIKLLEQFPEFLAFHNRERKPKGNGPSISEISEKTPEELIDEAYQDIQENLAADLLEQLKNCSPAFFERLVVELLVKMGYGGSRREAARAVGQTGDGGIDGIIDEDRLGLDAVYIQAKKWNESIGRPEIQKFAGALMGKKAKRGIFITTARFTPDAISYAEGIDYKIVLINGQRLAELMIEFDLGVTIQTTYKLKRIDSDFFGIE